MIDQKNLNSKCKISTFKLNFNLKRLNSKLI